jgi:serine/threonine-protein kinase
MNSAPEQRRIGPFLLKEEIGQGGMGVVYRGIYEKTGQEVAIKVLAPDLVADPKVEQRFVRETEILKKLRHPNIIRLFGAGSSKTQRFYAMELIEGGTLETLLRKKGRFTWQETIGYSKQIAQALEHAHNAGIVHRDLKPGNLLLGPEGVLKLSDFGIARDTQATALTQAGKTVGTMNYMAPEQITGKHPISGKTDLYALGCVMFQMLTGRPPFQANNQAELLFKHIDEVPPEVHDFNADVPRSLGDLIRDLLSKDPDDRPFDALAVQVLLDNVSQQVARQKTRQSELTQTDSSSPAEGKTRVDRSERTASVKKKKKKEQPETAVTPFYERTPFLVGVLVAMLIGIFAIYRYTVSESRLYSIVAPKMASADPRDWISVDRDLQRLVEWYPTGPHIEEARHWEEQVTIYKEQQRIQTSVRFSREPRNEAERLYREAVKFEEFGDRLTALDRYKAMAEMFTPKPGAVLSPEQQQQFAAARPTALLAKDQAARIEREVGGETDRLTFVRQQIDQAVKLLDEGAALEAKTKLENIVTLYGHLEEFQTLVQRARELLKK